MRTKRALIWVACVGCACALGFALQNAEAGLSGTSHDFTAETWNPGYACGVCHTPHNAPADPGVLLWNHEITVATYTPYPGVGGAPGNESRLCLSCHDGTVAIDAFGGGSGTVTMSTPFGTDMSVHHPLGFVFDGTYAQNHPNFHDPEVTQSGLGDTVYNDLLGGTGSVECTSCHEAHSNVDGHFMRVSNSSSELCLLCHDM